MDFGDLFRRSWDIIWNSKYMILLGFLAALGSGGSSSFNSRINANDFAAGPQTIEQMQQFWLAFSGIVLLLACLGLVIGIFLWLLRLTAQAGMISAADRLDEGEKMSFRQALSHGWQMLGRMVGLNFLLYGFFFVIGIVFVVILAATAGAGIITAVTGIEVGSGGMEAVLGVFSLLLFCFFILLCLMIPLYLIVTVIYPFAQRAIVLEDMGVTASIGRGWNIVKHNLGDVFLLIVIFLFIGLAFGFVAILLTLPVLLLSLAPVFATLLNNGTVDPLGVAWLFFAGIVFILVVAAVNSGYLAFRSTAVTLAYKEFVGRELVTEKSV